MTVDQYKHHCCLQQVPCMSFLVPSHRFILVATFLFAGLANIAFGQSTPVSTSAAVDPKIQQLNAFLDQTQSHLRNQDWDQAIASASSLIDRHPESLKPLVLRGLAKNGKKKFEEAIVTLI